MEKVQGIRGEGRLKTLLVGGLGYGAVCGLTFPLMISNTFLKEMSLSHGAGNSFGALFFIAYAVAMLVLALWHGLGRRALPKAALPAALGLVFLGNVLMMLRLFAVIGGGWGYAAVAALCIGFGLATAELGWLSRLAALCGADDVFLSRAVSVGYFSGGVFAAVIFFSDGPVELTFALGLAAASAALLGKMPGVSSRFRGEGGAASQAGRAGFIKAVSYLAVFSFVFGAVSQVVEASGREVAMIEGESVAGIMAAALVFLAASVARSRVFSVSDLYNVLFPVVAAALIALPFVATPWVQVLASTLIFVAFYLSGMNVRIIVSRLAEGDIVSFWTRLGLALGVGSLLVIGGVAFGATALAQGSPETALALVSLVSLFILAMNPVVSNRIDRRGGVAAALADEAGSGDGGPTAADPFTASIAAFADRCGMTSREGDVLRLLCQGRTRTYIADELGLSPNTVKGYIRNVYQKSGSVDKQDLLDRVELFREGR